MRTSKLSIIIEQDGELNKVLSNEYKTIKALFQSVCDILNVENQFKTEYLDYCVLNNTGTGEMTKNNLCISEKQGKKSSHALIDGAYEDPDRWSYRLYQYVASSLNRKIEEDEVLRNTMMHFKVAKRDNSYAFCLRTIIKIDGVEKRIDLGGDWIVDWNLIHTCEKEYDAASKAHMMVGHVFWPCVMLSGQTVNQARAATRKSIKETLEVLKQCYLNSFRVDEKKDDSLYKAFCRYKEWYQCFGVKEEGYEKYIEIFALKSLAEDEITNYNLFRVLESRRKEIAGVGL